MPSTRACDWSRPGGALGRRTWDPPTRHDPELKLPALSSLYEFLTDRNAVPTNPVKGVKRPKVDSYEGKTPAIADKEARQLMNLTNDKNLKGLRYRALLATLLYHGLPSTEDQGHPPRLGVLRVHGKGNKRLRSNKIAGFIITKFT
jgi:site-specific recombinase XerC